MKTRILRSLIISNLLLLLTLQLKADTHTLFTYEEQFYSCEAMGYIPHEIHGENHIVLYIKGAKRSNPQKPKLVNFRLRTLEDKIIPLKFKRMSEIKRSELTDYEKEIIRKKRFVYKLWFPMDYKKYGGSKFECDTTEHYSKGGVGIYTITDYVGAISEINDNKKIEDRVKVIQPKTRKPQLYKEVSKWISLSNHKEFKDGKYVAIYTMFTKSYLETKPDVAFHLRTRTGKIIPLKTQALSEIAMTSYESRLEKKRYTYRVWVPVPKDLNEYTGAAIFSGASFGFAMQYKDTLNSTREGYINN